jgi:hypothetical protein
MVAKLSDMMAPIWLSPNLPTLLQPIRTHIYIIVYDQLIRNCG